MTGKTAIGLSTKPPDGIGYPQLVKKGEPGFTVETVADHAKGRVEVRIDVDENGAPARVAIRQALGYRLDEKAVELYRLRPGTVNGTPAAVEMVVNQAFD